MSTYTPFMKTLSIYTLATLTTLALTLLSATAGENGPYVSGIIGFSTQTEEVSAFGENIAVDPTFPDAFDGGDGLAGGVGLGYRYDNFRIEGRVGTRNHEFDEGKIGTGERAGERFITDGELQSTTFTLEGFYDFDMGSAFTPYLKAGIGYSDNDYETKLGGDGVAGFDAFDGNVDGFYDAYADGSDDEFIWLVGLGVTLPVANSVSLFGEYQYISLGSVMTGADSFTDGFEIEDAAAHEVFAGVRYDF